MTAELALLGWSVILLVAQIVLQAGLAVSELGLPYAFGPRDDQRQPSSLYALRADRALHNLLQTFAAFAALAVAVSVAGRNGGLALVGAHLWFWGRVAYVPLYVTGIAIARTLVWVASIVGLLLMAIALVT